MFNILRLKRVTYNLGKVLETKEDITCAVDNNKLKTRLFKHENHLLLKSKNDPKPITYVISDMKFQPNLRITTDDSIIFLNCTFTNEVRVDMANSLTFTNNEYIITNNNFKYNDRFLIINNTNKVNFIDENFVNKASYMYPYDMKINSNNIKLERTNLYEENNGHINFKCNNLKINSKSNLSLKTGYIKTDNILIDYTSKINAKDKLIVEAGHGLITKDGIDCPNFILNGIRKDRSITNNNKKKIKRI